MINLTVTPSEVVAIWPGGPGYTRELFRSTQSGDVSNDSVIHHDLHVGSHIESSLHRSTSGMSVDELVPRGLWILRTQVIDARGASTISATHISQISVQTEMVLFLTDNTSRNLLFEPFVEDYVGLDLSASESLRVLENLRIIGSDYISIEGYQSDGSVHQNIFNNGLLVLETADLSGAQPGHYVAALSAQILQGAEAAQCQVNILEESDFESIHSSFENFLGQ